MSAVAIIAFTDRGLALARRLARELSAQAMRCGQPLSLEAWTRQHFQPGCALVFVGAAGIAVRAIAPYVRCKEEDPAVVVVDEAGRFAVPILSGHLGGANALAGEIAACIGATAVITTATDVNGVFAVDDWAREQGLLVRNPRQIRPVSAALLAGGQVRICSDWPISGQPPAGVRVVPEPPCDIRITLAEGDDAALTLVPKIAVLGVGCRRGMDRETLEAAFTALLAENSIPQEAVVQVCSIDRKREEPGLVAFCAAHGLPFVTFSPETLAKVQGSFTASDFVAQVTGVDNVCERSAVAGSGGGLVVPKRRYPGVTMALAAKPFHPVWR